MEAVLKDPKLKSVSNFFHTKIEMHAQLKGIGADICRVFSSHSNVSFDDVGGFDDTDSFKVTKVYFDFNQDNSKDDNDKSEQIREDLIKNPQELFQDLDDGMTVNLYFGQGEAFLVQSFTKVPNSELYSHLMVNLTL